MVASQFAHRLPTSSQLTLDSCQPLGPKDLCHVSVRVVRPLRSATRARRRLFGVGLCRAQQGLTWTPDEARPEAEELAAEITAARTPLNRALLSALPTATTPYSLSLLLRNGHVETVFAALARRKLHLLYDREVLHMPDGGCVCLDTEALLPHQQLPPDAPVLILLPGLTGGSENAYVQHAVRHTREAGIRAVVFNSRGTSGSPVKTPQLYSASFTEDLRNVIAHVQAKYPSSLLFAAGWSMGANILTRYLGEEGQATPLAAAASLCNPFNLPRARETLESGLSRLYNIHLGLGLRRIYRKHHHLFEKAAASGEKAFKPLAAFHATTISDFDEAITRVAFGWPSLEAYYKGSSSADVVHKIAIPYLTIQAKDDPIAPKEAIPIKALRDNPNCMLVLTPTGGHLGWCSGKEGPTEAPWSDWVLVEYFTAVQRLLRAECGGWAGPRPISLEPVGLYREGMTTHQAP